MGQEGCSPLLRIGLIMNWYQVSYGRSYTGPISSMTYVEADSYAQALARANSYCTSHERVQSVSLDEHFPKHTLAIDFQ